jgi:hypothetical protein
VAIGGTFSDARIFQLMDILKCRTRLLAIERSLRGSMRLRLSLVLFATVISACGGSPDESATASSSEQDLTARKPIPYVLQYVGEYDGDGAGHIDYVKLDRTGKLVISIDGRAHSGAFSGPSAVPDPRDTPTLKLVTSSGQMTARVDSDAPWKDHDTLAVTIHGRTETLTATWSSGREAMCDATQGSWTDDDADPATGLFCLCGAHRSFIPSLGGCVR